MYENNTESIIKAQSGDQEEMTKLIQSNNGLIWNIVKRFSGRGYELDDLYQIGCLGFIKSINRFDVSFEVRLSTYAVPYILGEIKRFIRDDGPIKISRSIKELGTKIAELQRTYQMKKGRDITIKEISQELKVTREDIVMALEAINSVSSIEEATYTDNKTDKTISLLDKIASKNDEATMITNKLTVKKLIEELDKKDREVILLRFYSEKTQTQVSKILGISQVQVSRIERKILDKMRKSLIAK